MSIETPDVGLHEGVPAADYHQWHAANFSSLKEFRYTPLHVYQALVEPSEEAPATSLGTATHLAVLEPEAFERCYAKSPPGDARLKKYKDELREIVAADPNREIIRYDDWHKIAKMRDAVWAHPRARELLSGQGLTEVSCLWHDSETGILCRSRVDRIGMTREGWPCVVDFKTFGDYGGRLEPYAVEKVINDYSYHIQGAHYLSGLEALAPCQRRFILLFVEKNPPHGVRLVELDLGSIELGRRQLRRWLRRLKHCQESGEWPGWSSDFDVMGVPSFAYSQEEEGDE